MTMFAFEIGDVRIDRVEEAAGLRVKVGDLLAGVDPSAIERNLGWLAPHAYDPATGELITTLQSFIVRTRHHTVLIDACAGNHKNRPDLLAFHQLNTDWLERLAAMGVAPESVDFVMCTHMHADHVGWNTRLLDGRWVPTFPNARYVFNRVELEHWDPQKGAGTGWGQAGVFEDSVLPCIEAGLAQVVDDGFTIDDRMWLESAPGHSPGHCVIRTAAQGQSAIFTGDCMHSPLQIACPEISTVACTNPADAVRSRRRVLSEAAERRSIIVPAHFPAPFAGTVTADGDGFAYHPRA
jgi:glyoxylase-like metal-dependent hydrolase (beta-lactamase superfamily II)